MDGLATFSVESEEIYEDSAVCDHPTEALGDYVADNRDELIRYALKVSHNRDMAEDLVQQAFVNTYEVIRRGTRILNLQAWLRRCIRNAYVNDLRVEKPVPIEDEHDALPSSVTTLEMAAMRCRLQDVASVVDAMPDHYRVAFVLAEIRGLGYVEISERIDRSVDAVAQILHRARNHVRARVSDCA